MYFIGIDPDLHATGVAVIDENGKLVFVGCCKSPVKGDDAVSDMARRLSTFFLRNIPLPTHAVIAAIESQEVAYTARSGANPRSIIPVAQVAGAAAAALWSYSGYCVTEKVYMPKPQAWKGSVPKRIHQARIYGKMGWGTKVHGTGDTTYCQPLHGSPEAVVELIDGNPGDWKHVGDALGLALWARETFNRDRILRGNLKGIETP